MLTINLEFDANAQAAPQSFRNGIQAAANILQAAIFDPITVNVGIGYGDYGAGSASYQALTGNESYGGIGSVLPLSYPALINVLAAHESTSGGAQAIASLPQATSLNGKTGFFISNAEAKAFGAIPANAPGIDGYAGFPTSFAGTGLVDTGVTELAHALGLDNGGGVETLVEYTSPGNHLLTAGTTGTPAYFSTDGGFTNLANFNVQNDSTLFQNQAADPLDFPSTGSALTQLDLTMLSILGFNVASTPVIPGLSIIPGTTAAGGAPTLTVQAVSVAEGSSTPASSLIKSVSVPSGDTIGYYAFMDLGGGSGHFAINGLAEPDNQWIDVLATQLTALRYVGGATAGNDRLEVYGYDTTANTSTSFSPFTAMTYAPTLYSVAANADGSATKADGTTGTTTYGFTVSRSGDASQAATLTYVVAGSGSNPAPDTLFASPSGAVTFAAGATSVTLPVVVIGATVSAAETFTVTLSGPSGTAIGTSVATGTILAIPGAGFANTAAATTITSALPQAQTIQAYAHYDLYSAPASSITNVGSNLSSVALDAQGDVAVYTSRDAAMDGHVIRADGTGTSVISSGDGADSIVASNGADLIATGVGTNTIYLVSGNNTLASEGTDTVNIGGGSDTISVSGNMVLNPGMATVSVSLNPNATLGIHTGVGSITVNGGYGSGTFSGGTNGNNLLIAGTGPTTLYAGGNGDALVASGGSRTTMFGWSGNETMIGQYSQGIDTFTFDGANVFATGGMGTNVFNLGSGNNNVVGLQGTDTFNVTNGTAGGSTYISDFNLNADKLHLSGYAADEVSHALNTATFYQGSEILALRDGTQISFGHVTGLTQSNFV